MSSRRILEAFDSICHGVCCANVKRIALRTSEKVVARRVKLRVGVLEISRVTIKVTHSRWRNLTASDKFPQSPANVPMSVSSKLINYTANNKLSFIPFSINYPLRTFIHRASEKQKQKEARIQFTFEDE